MQHAHLILLHNNYRVGENIGEKFSLKEWWGNIWQIVKQYVYIINIALAAPENFSA